MRRMIMRMERRRRRRKKKKKKTNRAMIVFVELARRMISTVSNVPSDRSVLRSWKDDVVGVVFYYRYHYK
jgi:hypothetical protein